MKKCLQIIGIILVLSLFMTMALGSGSSSSTPAQKVGEVDKTDSESSSAKSESAKPEVSEQTEFRVGDIVTINGFRGTVTDIGLRTTKISGGGNVKIFNNSEISGVLNMTNETSVAAATIGLEYGQDINYVEEVLARELPILKEQNKTILD